MNEDKDPRRDRTPNHTGGATGAPGCGASPPAAAVVRFGLACAKRRVPAGLDSAPLRSEAAMTSLDGVLSVLTLTGLALNAALGWWWADPAAALIVAIAAANEARENRREAAELPGGSARSATARPGGAPRPGRQLRRPGILPSQDRHRPADACDRRDVPLALEQIERLAVCLERVLGPPRARQHVAQARPGPRLRVERLGVRQDVQRLSPQ